MHNGTHASRPSADRAALARQRLAYGLVGGFFWVVIMIILVDEQKPMLKVDTGGHNPLGPLVYNTFWLLKTGFCSLMLVDDTNLAKKYADFQSKNAEIQPKNNDLEEINRELTGRD